jgi:hypothetical protein
MRNCIGSEVDLEVRFDMKNKKEISKGRFGIVYEVH